MLLRLSRQAQQLTKDASVIGRISGATRGLIGAAARPVVAGLKTKPGRAVIGTTALTGMLGAEGARRGTGAAYMQNPYGDPTAAISDTVSNAYRRIRQ